MRIPQFVINDASMLRGAKPDAVIARVYELSQAFPGEVIDYIDPENKELRQAILRDAEKPESPLHPIFEWDNRIAGTAYRLIQAKQLMRNVRCTVEKEGGGEIHIKSSSVKREKPAPLARPHRTASQQKLQKFSEGISALLDWNRKYEDVEEFTEFRGTIETTVQNLLEEHDAKTEVQVG